VLRLACVHLQLHKRSSRQQYYNIINDHYTNSPARKFIELSVASAFAMRVLEQPGGPYSSTPLGGEMPREAKSSGRCRGHSTTC
jgi:hypothetical protein